MGCLSHRSKETRQYTDQKWDYINLSDFKAKGCGAVFAYITLWLGLIISLAVYGVDTFTAVQLLIFNRWSSEIEPAIPFSVSKWIFSICIILSFVNLGFEWIRAARKIKRGNVAEVYLDSLAVRWESIRVGSGQGFKRFLVFTELTKSKKGAEYIALFTYFSFQSWIRVIFCTSPRQVVNALTLRSVYIAQLAVSSDSVEGSISGFFDKIKTLAQQDLRQALILGGMCFTLLVWVFSALYLISAAVFYTFFLFHWIPRSDGGLTGYCERKVNSALLKIVTKTVNKALAKGQADRMKAAMTEKGGAHPDTTIPTLPNLGVFTQQSVGVTPPLPAYTSTPATPVGDFKRQMPPRTMTGASTLSYSSRAPLVSSAADMGYSNPRSASPEDMTPTVPYLQRTRTGDSFGTNAPQQDMNHMRTSSNSSYRQQPLSQSPGSMGPAAASPLYAPTAKPIPSRFVDNYGANQQMQDDGQSWRGPPPRVQQTQDDNQSWRGPPPRSNTFNSEGRSNSTAPSAVGSSIPSRFVGNYNGNYDDNQQTQGDDQSLRGPPPRSNTFNNKGRSNSTAPSAVGSSIPSRFASNYNGNYDGNQQTQDDDQSWRGPPPRSNTFNNEGRSSPAPSAVGSSIPSRFAGNYNGNQQMQGDNQSRRGLPPRSNTFNNEGRSSPAPSAAGSSYPRVPQQPVRSATSTGNPVPLRGLRFSPQRQMTEPMSNRAPAEDNSYPGQRMPPNRPPVRQNTQDYFNQQAPSGASYGYDVEAQDSGRY